MRFEIAKDVLLRALIRVAPFVPNNPLVKVMEFILLSFSDNELSIQARSISSGIIIKALRGSGNGSSDACVPAKLFIDTIKAIPDGEVLTLLAESSGENKGSLQLFCDGKIKAEFKLNGENPADFPQWPKFPKGKLKINPIDFANGLSSVFFTVGNDETRMQMLGVHLHTKGDKLRFVGTDGFRVAFRELAGIPGLDDAFTIHRKFIPEAISVLNGMNNCEMAKDSNRIHFREEGVEIFGSLIEEKFPAYELYLKEYTSPTLLRVNRIEFSMTLKRMTAFSDAIISKVVFDMKGNKLELTTSDYTYDRSSIETINVESSGKDKRFALSIKKLLDTLASIDTENVEFTINEHNTGIYLKPVDEKADFSIFLMPVHLEENVPA